MNYCSICRAKIDESENLCTECKFRGRRSTDCSFDDPLKCALRNLVRTGCQAAKGASCRELAAILDSATPTPKSSSISPGIRSALQAIVDESEVCTPENMQRFWQAVDAGKQALKQSA